MEKGGVSMPIAPGLWWHLQHLSPGLFNIHLGYFPNEMRHIPY